MFRDLTLDCEIFSRHDVAMKNIALILSGCGHQNGAEVTEAVSLLVTLSALGAKVQCFAPNMDVQGQNLLAESQKIARGNALDLAQLNSKNYDALAFAGGFGVARFLCDWAEKGSKAQVHSEVKRVILDFHQGGKPIAAVCIAPVLLALTLGSKRVTLTIGNDPETAAEIEKTGAQHEACSVDDFISDRDHKIVSAPAYMYDHALPHQVFRGIEGLSREFFEMA